MIKLTKEMNGSQLAILILSEHGYRYADAYWQKQKEKDSDFWKEYKSYLVNHRETEK